MSASENKHQDLRDLKTRAHEYADQIVSTMSDSIGPGVKQLLRTALSAGWIIGYAEAMTDVVIITEAANAVKH